MMDLFQELKLKMSSYKQGCHRIFLHTYGKISKVNPFSNIFFVFFHGSISIVHGKLTYFDHLKEFVRYESRRKIESRAVRPRNVVNKPQTSWKRSSSCSYARHGAPFSQTKRSRCGKIFWVNNSALLLPFPFIVNTKFPIATTCF